MSWLNPALLFGLILVGVPLILHLLFRPKPKKLIFPALRLILARRQQNVRRLQLRHFWLLLLRMLVVGVIVIALARPSVPPANYGFTWLEGFSFLGVIAIATGIYFFFTRAWQQRSGGTRTEFLTRRAYLRTGTLAGTILLLLLLVGLPYGLRVGKEMSAPPQSAAEKLPVAALFLFDTSVSLQYRFEGKPRLDAAKEIAYTHLSRLPADSKVAVAETGSTNPPVFYADLSAARSRIESLKADTQAIPLDDRLRAALKSQEEDRQRITSESGNSAAAKANSHDRYVREIYIFTDLAKSAWKADATSQLKDELKRLAEVGLYLIDVGIEQPVNAGLSRLRLSRQSLPAGRPFSIEATVQAVGQTDPVTVELFVNGDDGKPVKRASQAITPTANAEARLKFPMEGLTGQFHQGELRISASDPLAADDVVFWSVNLHVPPKVLVVAESTAEAREWMDALAPPELIALKRASYQPQFLASSKLSSTELQPFDVVCLINVANPADDQWVKLANYVEQGGGLAVFTGQVSKYARADGRGINPEAYKTAAAQAVLPAELKASLKFNSAALWDSRGSNHPLLQRLEAVGANAELAGLEFRRYWSVTPNAQAAILIRYNQDGQPPALLERVVGSGRVLLCTTSVDSVQWNDLLPSWFYIAFADQMMQHLSRTTAGIFNYEVGDDARIPVDVAKAPRNFLIRQPDSKQTPAELPRGESLLRIPRVTTVGQYQIVAREAVPPFQSGFSVNLRPEECNLTRLETSDLDNWLGEKRYGLSRDPASLSRQVVAGRLGQEVFGLVLLALMTFFLLEHLTANWFYAGESNSEKAATAMKRPTTSPTATNPPPTVPV